MKVPDLSARVGLISIIRLPCKESYLDTATNKLEQLLDDNAMVNMDNYFIYDCLRLVKYVFLVVSWSSVG